MEPPEMINAGDLVMKRWEPEWADDALAAVKDSMAELQPFMPWAVDGYDLEASRDFLARSNQGWANGTEFNYAIFTSAGELVGAIGLMTRMGPGVLEIGYWTRTPYAGRGYMTAAVEAITRVALAMPGIERVAIKHDAVNAGSGRVAAKAGFTEVGRLSSEPEAPGESGTTVVRERSR